MKFNNILKVEKGCLIKIYEILYKYNINGKILFVTDPIVEEFYGKQVCSQIEKLGEFHKEYVNNNTIEYSMKLAEKIINNDVDYIIGLGGGKVLDVCKYAAYVSKKVFISIPTTIANDGIASPIAVLKKNDSKPKSLGCSIPEIILIDTDLIKNSPIQLIKAGIGDAISNYMALIDWEFACKKNKDVMNSFAYLIAKNSLDALMNTEFNEICDEFINVLANSLILSGIAMEFAGSSRPVSGSEHLFSHALDYYSETNNLHGIQVALGTIAILKLLNFDYKHLLNYLNKFEVDINPKRLGISKEVFIKCMQNATTMRSNRYTYLHELNLNNKILKNLYDELVEEL